MLETFLVKKDDASPAMAPDDPDQYQLSDHDAGDPPGIDIGDVTIAAGFRIFLGGKIEVGPLEVSGSFTIEINPTFVQFTAVAKLKLGDIGQLNFTGAMRFDADGLVINTTISLAAGSGFGSAIDLDISGSITFQLNTSNKVKNVGGLVDPGFRFRIQAAVTFIGFADATGVIEISINQDKFELYFDVAIALGPITVRATGFAGVYADGLVLYLDVALDVNLLEIVKMNASGKLRLNTTAAPKTIPGGISIDVGFRLAMTGQLKVLEVITLQATFVMQVGGTGAGVQVCSGGASICNDPDSGIGHVEQLSKGDWFISLTATADFFGLASMSASGWIDSKGHFGLRLHGEMVLGSRSFGLVGEFTFSVLLKEETNPANGLTEYHFRVFFSADVDARLFGITFAGVGLSASVEARGAGGEVDLVASVTVRIKILFIRISKTVRFKIGTIQLPKQVYLAGEGPSATVGTALWRGATTPQALYLNMGQRAQAAGDFTGRGIGDSNASEIFIIEHVGGTAGNETLRVKGMGREKTYVGVTMLYAYAGNGSDTIIVREGVLVDVHLEGGAGRDVILFSGSGNAVICGDRCSGTAAGVEGTPVHEDDDSDSSTPAENDDENPAVNDTPEPGDDAIEIGLKAGGGPDTRTIVVHGDGGDDYLSYLGTGSAQLYGDDGDDVVTGGPGADVLDGGAGSDEITGGGGLDTIVGGIGNDVIKLGLPTAANFPRIEAGEGSDVLIVTATDGNDNLGISDPDGGDDIQIAKLGAPDQRLLANDVEELVVDLGPGADTVIVTSLHGSSVENVTINAGKVVTKLGEHLIDDPDEADPSRKILAPIFNIADDGATDVIRIAGREATDDTFNLSGIVSGEAGAGTVDGIRVAHVGVADFYISNTKRAGENDRVVIQGLSGDDVLDAASLGDTDVLAAPVYPDLAVIELDGGDGKDRLIGSPFADVLRSGTGDDTVTGGLGRDTFFDEGGFDTLVEVQNADMTLFDDRFVVGSLRNDDDTGPFASSSYQNEAFLIDAIRTGVNPSFRNFGSGDRYAAGATVEEIKGIFEQAYLTGGEANNTLAVSDPDNVFYVGGIAQTGNPWRGRAVLDAKGSDGAAPEHYLITIALDSHARIEIADTGGAAGVDRLILFGTNQADVFTLDATGSGAFRVGIVQASEVSQQRVTFRGMERVEVYTFEGADRILTDDTAATTVIDMGAGDDEIVIGTVPLIPDPGNRTLEFPDGVPVADTENMTNGNSNPLFVLGGDQNDRFEVNTNKAKLWLHGGNGNDRFLLKTFLVLKENADDPNDITNLASLFGGAGANRYDYLQNAPVFINGGAGVDTIVVVGTPIGDVFVVTDAYVAGAGRLVTFTNVEAVEVDGAGGDDTIYVLSTGEHFETIVTGGSGNDTIHVGGDAPTLVFDPPPFEYTPPPFLVSLPPELVYDTIPLNLDNFTFRVPLGEWLARGGQLIPNGQTGDPVAEAAGMAVLQGFISRWAQSLGLLGSSVLLELTEVGGITARPRWNFFFSFLFDPTIEVTVSTLRLNLKIGRMEERTQLVQPPKTIVDPQPFALDAGRNLDISKILNRLTIRGGDQFETAGVGDRVVVHNEEGRAATGKLFVRKTVRRKANGEIGGMPVFTFDLDAQGNKQYDSYLTLQGGGLGIDAGSVSADGTEYDGVEMTGIEQLDLRLADGDGTAGNTGRDDFTVLSTPAGLNLTIWAGGGDDTVRIHGIGGQTTVAGGAGQRPRRGPHGRRRGRQRRRPRDRRGRRAQRDHRRARAPDRRRRERDHGGVGAGARHRPARAGLHRRPDDRREGRRAVHLQLQRRPRPVLRGPVRGHPRGSRRHRRQRLGAARPHDPDLRDRRPHVAQHPRAGRARAGGAEARRRGPGAVVRHRRRRDDRLVQDGRPGPGGRHREPGLRRSRLQQGALPVGPQPADQRRVRRVRAQLGHRRRLDELAHRRRRRLAPDLLVPQPRRLVHPQRQRRRGDQPDAHAEPGRHPRRRALPGDRPLPAPRGRRRQLDRGLPRHAHRRRAERRHLRRAGRRLAHVQRDVRGRLRPAQPLDRRRGGQRHLLPRRRRRRAGREPRQLRHQVRRPRRRRALHRRLRPQGRAGGGQPAVDHPGRRRRDERLRPRPRRRRGRRRRQRPAARRVLLDRHRPRRDARHLLPPGARAQAGMPVTYGAGIANYHLPANRVGKVYFGGETARDPFTGEVLTYRAGDDLTVYDLFNPVRTPVLDPFGNPLTYAVGDVIRHIAGDPVTELLGRPQAWLGGEPVSDERLNAVFTGSTRFLYAPGQVKLYNRGERLYDLVEAFGCSAENVCSSRVVTAEALAGGASVHAEELLPAHRHRRRHGPRPERPRAGGRRPRLGHGLRRLARLQPRARRRVLLHDRRGHDQARLRGPGALRDRDRAPGGPCRRRPALPRRERGHRPRLARHRRTRQPRARPGRQRPPLDRPGAHDPPPRALQLGAGDRHVLRPRSRRHQRPHRHRRRRGDHELHAHRPARDDHRRPRRHATGARVVITYMGPRLQTRGTPVYALVSGQYQPATYAGGQDKLALGNEARTYLGGEQAYYESDDLQVTRQLVQRLAMTGTAGLGDAIFHFGIEALTVITGGGDDDVTVVSTHTGTTRIETGGGADRVAVRTIAGDTAILTGTGDDHILVGSAAGFWPDALPSFGGFYGAKGVTDGIARSSTWTPARAPTASSSTTAPTRATTPARSSGSAARCSCAASTWPKASTTPASSASPSPSARGTTRSPS